MLTSTFPDVADNSQFSMTELCKLLTISRVTANKYIKEGWLRCHYNMTNRRVFTGLDVKEFYSTLTNL